MRKYLPTISDLIDRLTIVQLKEVFIPEHKKEYAKEIKDIMHDLELEGLDSKLIRAVIVVSQMNLHIWHNEAEARNGINAGENLTLEYTTSITVIYQGIELAPTTTDMPARSAIVKTA